MHLHNLLNLTKKMWENFYTGLILDKTMLVVMSGLGHYN